MSRQAVFETRAERPYVGSRTVMAMRDFDREIPAMLATVSRWLEAHQVRPSGQPLLRFHVIDMPERMDVELGIPTDGAPGATGEVQSLQRMAYVALACDIPSSTTATKESA